MDELNLCIFCGKEPEKPRQYGYQIAPRRNKCYCIDHSCDNGLLVSVHGFSREEVVEKWNKIMPAADVAEVRHAKWISEEHEDRVSPTMTHKYTWYYCSECGRRLVGYSKTSDAPYCHCGARMDLEV